MILRDKNNYFRLIEFNTSTFRYIELDKAANDENVQGVFCKTETENIYFYVAEDVIKLVYENSFWSLKDVCKYSFSKKGLTSLTLKNTLGVSRLLTIKVGNNEIPGDFTQREEEDFNFLLWLLNVSRDKERQEIIISSYMKH